MKTGYVNGYQWFKGANAVENWNILSKASQKYWFFHLANRPSPYVIWTGKSMTKIIALELGFICISSTKYNAELVDYCQCSNVKKGDVVGEVFYKSNRKIKRVRVSKNISF